MKNRLKTWLRLSVSPIARDIALAGHGIPEEIASGIAAATEAQSKGGAK